MCFRFEYGILDDETVWIRPPSGNFFNVNQLTLRIILELNSGSRIKTVKKKYDLEDVEVDEVLKKFEVEKAIVGLREGGIRTADKRENFSLTPAVLLLLALCFVQIEYFKDIARTLVMKSFHDALAVGIAALLAVFFHELGHYLTSRPYFRPRVGFTFLSVFPAIYVDTQEAWCLPKNVRMLINAGGLLADMVVNALAIALVLLYRPLEYFVTPFLMLQLTRLAVVLNPFFPGDGYWIVSDVTGVVNLAKKGLSNLLSFRFNLLSLFGLFSVLLTVLSLAGFAWYLFNLSWKLILYIKSHFPLLNAAPFYFKSWL